MRLITRLTDALVERLVPSQTAQAICAPDGTQCYGCTHGWLRCCDFYLGGCAPTCYQTRC